MKKNIVLIFVAFAAAFSLTSCDKDLEWHDTTDEEINYWTRTNLFLYFVNKDGKQYFSIDNPTQWPVITDKVLTTAEVQRAMTDVKTQKATITVSGATNATFSGYTFCDGKGFATLDPDYNMPFVLPSVKVDNTGKTETFLYIQTSKGIDTDTLTAKLRYAKEDGQTYSEVTDIYYNKEHVYAGAGKNIGVIVQKD
jgi:hypothetical protein